MEEEEEEGPITVTIKEEELEEQIRNLLHSMEEKETIDGVDMERIISVLVAAREMLLEEKQALAVCPVSPSDILGEDGVVEEEVEEEVESTSETTPETTPESSESSVEPAPESTSEELPAKEESSEWHIASAPTPAEGEWGFSSLLREVKEEWRELKEVRQEVRAVRRDDVHELVREMKEEIEEVKEELSGKKKVESVSEEKEETVSEEKEETASEEKEEMISEVKEESTSEVKEETTPDTKEESSNEESALMERAEHVLEEAQTIQEASVETAAEPEENVEIVEVVEQPIEEPAKEEVEETAEQPSEESAKPIEQSIEQPITQPSEQITTQPTTQPDAFGFNDWSRAAAVLEQARRRLLPAVSPAILKQVETAIEQGMSSVNQQLREALESTEESEVREAIAKLEQELREATVEEANRLYSVLSEQRRELENRFEDEMAEAEEKIRKAVRDELSPMEKEEVAKTLQEYKARVTALQRTYIDHLDDLVYAEEMLEKGRRLQKEEALREELQEESAVETADVKRMMEEDTEEKTQVGVRDASEEQALKETQKKIDALMERIERTRRVFEEVLVHQERQRAFIHLQQAALHGGDMQEATTALQRKAGDDVILQHLLAKIPASIREKGVPSTVYYLTEFESLRKEAKTASKTAEDASFAGQLLGRAVVSMVGTEGVDPNDPLVQIERMNACLSE